MHSTPLQMMRNADCGRVRDGQEERGGLDMGQEKRVRGTPRRRTTEMYLSPAGE